ncbi:hypothetical protein V8G54_001487 [Vigna mungo]|uniref:Uncharacterized protein n=1 Tax=Vigna mungo TaxID=3915 RepID=A0AAQ3PAI3_VIGMU
MEETSLSLPEPKTGVIIMLVFGYGDSDASSIPTKKRVVLLGGNIRFSWYIPPFIFIIILLELNTEATSMTLEMVVKLPLPSKATTISYLKIFKSFSSPNSPRSHLRGILALTVNNKVTKTKNEFFMPRFNRVYSEECSTTFKQTSRCVSANRSFLYILKL